MSTFVTVKEALPRLKARLAGVFYLLTIVTGAFAAMSSHGRTEAGLIASVCYIGVTVLFYGIFKPVNRSISLLAMLFSLAGCAFGLLSPFHFAPPIDPLVFFGVYCLLIGFLILKSRFLPRILGVLMVCAGLGWLTFISPPLAKYLAPYNLAPGLLGEGALTLWLLVVGVNAQQWKEQASFQ